MSPKSDSIRQPLSPSQQFRSILGHFSEVLQTRMDDYSNTYAFKLAVYLIEGILIGLFTFLWLEYAQMGELYHWLFPLIVSSTIVLTHYIITEILVKFRKPLTRTIGIFWLISFAGVIAGFILVYLTGICGFICQITGSYCPVEWHTSPPDTIAVFFKTILLPWVIFVVVLTQGIKKRQLAKELATIRQINNLLDQNIPVNESRKIKINDANEKTADGFRIPLKDGFSKIAFNDIYFIAVEDHYCKIVFNRNGKIYNEYVRSSLKDALNNLPPGNFAQVHRSYAVNLGHVKHIKKQGQTYQLYVKGSESFLPASRHRAHTFLPRLKELLN
jgi:hypothetical protein